MEGFLKYFEDEKSNLRRSKSLCSLNDELHHKVLSKDRIEYHERVRTASESSAEVLVINDTDSEDEGHCRSGTRRRGGCSFNSKVLAALENKIDRLSDIFLEQCRLLSEIKEEIQESRETIGNAEYLQSKLFPGFIEKIVTQRSQELIELEMEGSRKAEPNSRAQCLLDALEVNATHSLDREVRDALTTFLQSDELRERIVSATAASVREAVAGSVARHVTALCLPALQRSQRRLARHAARAVEDTFAELEEHWSQVSRQMYRTSRTLRRTLERGHGPLRGDQVDKLRGTVEGLLDKELKQWRQKVLNIFTSELTSTPVAPRPECEERPPSPASSDYPLVSPASPAQPADPDKSIIDQLMRCAEISKQIEDGDVNGSFSRALSAADLSLVMAACRAAGPARVFGPCRLQQPVLLALLQQLATDMLHETHLKCRYLEEALISLNPSNPATRAHLATVVGEVRRHLAGFLAAYPKHAARRRVALIIMAADNLLNCCC